MTKPSREVSGEDGAGRRRVGRRVYSPRVDILESDEAFTLIADVPGSDAESVEVTAEKDRLVIRAGTHVYEPEGFKLSYAESRPEEYQCAFKISALVDREKLSATAKDGVLTITLPKARAVRPRKVPVRTG